MEGKRQWKDVKGFEGLYQVSDAGEVRSVSHDTKNNINGGMRHVKGRVLKQYKMPNGYMQVCLSKNETRAKKYVHRIVAEAFMPNEKNLSDVNHIDGDKENNNLHNLEWTNHKDNQRHMVKNKMTKKAMPVICITTGTEYSSLSEAQRETGIERHRLKKLCEEGIEWERI